MKDPILAAANADIVRNAFKNAGVHFEDSNIVSLSTTDANSLGSALASATLSSIQAQVCSAISFAPSSCGTSDIMQLDSKILSTKGIGNLINCPTCTDLTLAAAISNTMQKAAAFDSSFTSIAGSAATGDVVRDVNTFNGKVSLLTQFGTAFSSIVSAIMPSTFTVNVLVDI